MSTHEILLKILKELRELKKFLVIREDHIAQVAADAYVMEILVTPTPLIYIPKVMLLSAMFW